MQYQWSFNLLVVFVLTGCGGGGGGSDTAPDTTAPTVKSTAPSSAQTAVGRNIVVSVLFSESMNGTTISQQFGLVIYDRC
jgi:hypothetical protein